MCGNQNMETTIAIIITPVIRRLMKNVLVGSLVAFQLSNVFHITFGIMAFNKP